MAMQWWYWSKIIKECQCLWVLVLRWRNIKTSPHNCILTCHCYCIAPVPLVRWRLPPQLQHRHRAGASFHPNILLLIYFIVFTDDRWRGSHIVVVTFGQIGNIFGENICDTVEVVLVRRHGRAHVRGGGVGPGPGATFVNRLSSNF